MSLDKEKLLALREAILDKLLPLIESEGIDPEDKFTLTLQIADLRQSSELYQKAFDIAGAIDAQGDKMQAYLDLLSSVDGELEDAADAEATNAAAASPVVTEDQSSDVQDQPRNEEHSESEQL